MRIGYVIFLFLPLFGCIEKTNVSEKTEVIEVVERPDGPTEIITGVDEFKNKEAERLNGLGISYIRDNDYNQAEEKFIAAYRIEPDNPTILNNLGNIYQEKGTVRMALEYYTESFMASDSTYLKAAHNMGLMYAANEDFDKSLEIFDYVLAQTKSENQRLITSFEISRVLAKQNECMKAHELYNSIEEDIKNLLGSIEEINKLEQLLKDCMGTEE